MKTPIADLNPPVDFSVYPAMEPSNLKWMTGAIETKDLITKASVEA